MIDHYPIPKNIMKCNLQRFESLMMNILTLSLEPLIFNLKSELNKNRDGGNEETKKYVIISLRFVIERYEVLSLMVSLNSMAPFLSLSSLYDSS